MNKKYSVNVIIACVLLFLVIGIGKTLFLERISLFDGLKCLSSGGDYKRVGLLGTRQCIYKYSDGGKTCNSSKECLGGCLVQSYKDLGPGKCKEDNQSVGLCTTTIEQARSGQGGLCID